MNNHIYEDEIDLRELWYTLVKYKSFIVGFTIFITIGAIVFVLNKTPIYEVVSNVQIGHIGEELLDTPEVITKNIEVYFQSMDLKENKFKHNMEVGKVSSITQPKKMKNFITIKTQAISNKIALQKNKEVVKYIKQLYYPKIEQVVRNTKHHIKSIQKSIQKINDFDKQNIKRKIEVAKNRQTDIIDAKIKRLYEQDILMIKDKITRLKTQDIVKLNHQIDFLKNQKVKSLDRKIKFYEDNLQQYTKNVNDIYHDMKYTKNTTFLTVSALQMTTYQNLILNANNKIENLKIEKEKILLETIEDLKIKKDNIKNVQIKELNHKIDNIKNITIYTLKQDKLNITNDIIRKLQYKLKVELPNKIIQLQDKIAELQFHISSQNLMNSSVIGDYIVYGSPIKPKKQLIIIVAFVTALILSIFISFLLNFFSLNKEIKKDQD